jgi:AcrR family transcriptional regulator
VALSAVIAASRLFFSIGAQQLVVDIARSCSMRSRSLPDNAAISKLTKRYTFRSDLMPRSSRERTRLRILQAAYVLFRQKGFTRVNVDEIAEAAKITKRTLYSHFESKNTLLADVLEAQHGLAFSGFQTIGRKLSGTPQAIVDTFFGELDIWAAKPRWTGSGFTRLVVELADLPGHPARKVAKRHKAVLEGHLAEVLAEAGVEKSKERARELWLLAEGAMVLILIHGDRSYASAAAEAGKKLLASDL